MSYGTEDHKHNAYDVYGVADEHHRHYDTESEIRGLREDLSRADARIRDLEDSQGELREELRDTLERIRQLEDRLPDYASPEEPEESPLARRDAYIGTWSGQDVTRREEP